MPGVGVGFGFFRVGNTGARVTGVGLARGLGVGETRSLICVGAEAGVELKIGNGEGVGLDGVTIMRGGMD
jgi:hypothetical protein